MKIPRICPACGNNYSITMEEGLFNRWRRGECIQNVATDWTPEQCERLISGICSNACWDKFLGGPTD